MQSKCPAGSPSTPPPPSPFTAVVYQESSITLDEWWLARVDGHDRKIAVAGFFDSNQAALEFASAPIAKRYDACILETEDGISVFLYGFFNSERTLQNGFTIEACDKFCLGFPHWWKQWKNVLYPKMMSSQAGCKPSSSTTSNLHEDSNALSSSMVECTNDESKSWVVERFL